MWFSLHDGQEKQQPGVPRRASVCQAEHEDDDGRCIATAVLVTLEERSPDCWCQQVLSRKS